jgi:hypothetical protein
MVPSSADGTEDAATADGNAADKSFSIPSGNQPSAASMRIWSLVAGRKLLAQNHLLEFVQ